MEIILKNNQSDTSQSLQTYNNFNAAIAAGGAIGGAAVGSILTYIAGKKNEERKAEKEKKLIAEIMDMIRSELKTYSDFLTDVSENTYTYTIKGDPPDMRHIRVAAKPIIHSRIETFPLHYKEITIERKMAALGGEGLAKVGTAYKSFHQFTSAMVQNPDDYNESDLRRVSGYINDALVSMNSQ